MITNMTVGELISELESYPKEMPIHFEEYVISRIREKGDMCHIELITQNDHAHLQQDKLNE